MFRVTISGDVESFEDFGTRAVAVDVLNIEAERVEAEAVYSSAGAGSFIGFDGSEVAQFFIDEL